MSHILDWPPIVWALRIALLIVGIAGLYLFLLLMARATRMIVIRNRALDRIAEVREKLRLAVRALAADASKTGAESIAKREFYASLIEQFECAKRGTAFLPDVPPAGELTFVNGFLVWRGRPVWWSAEGARRARGPLPERAPSRT